MHHLAKPTLGYDFVELLVPEQGEIDLGAARTALAEAGLGVVLAARVNLQRNLASENTASHRAGIDYLLRTQGEDGNWSEDLFTGTGFPKVFYLKYHLYRLYFPLMALARYEQSARPAPVVGYHISQETINHGLHG